MKFLQADWNKYDIFGINEWAFLKRRTLFSGYLQSHQVEMNFKLLVLLFVALFAMSEGEFH